MYREFHFSLARFTEEISGRLLHCPATFVVLNTGYGEGPDFEMACSMAAMKISVEASRFEFLRTSPALSEEERGLYVRLLNRNMDLGTIRGGLCDLCRLLEKHYGRKVILLIDEYDVPLQKAFYGGYYDELIQLICAS